MKNIFYYVDETGQDTQGKLFIVACAIVLNRKDYLEKRLLQIEKETGKYLKKWQKTRIRERLAYIEAILKMPDLKGHLYFAEFQDAGKEYLTLIIYSLAQLILSQGTKQKNNVIIDALTLRQRQKVGVGLRRFGIKTGKIRGKKDEASPFLRLADALAGFVRDGVERNSNCISLFNQALKNSQIKRID